MICIPAAAILHERLKYVNGYGDAKLQECAGLFLLDHEHENPK